MSQRQNQWAHLSQKKTSRQELVEQDSDSDSDSDNDGEDTWDPDMPIPRAASASESEQSDDNDDDESGGSDSEDAPLADLTFGEMIDMKRNGSVRGYQPAEASADGGETRGKRAKPVRLNKHRPLEVTSKKPVSRHREIQIDAPRRKKSRDPRFDTMSGRFDDVGFAKSYEFLDGYRQIESAELKVKSRKTKDWKKSAAFKLEAQQLASQTSMRQQKLKVAKRKGDVKKISRDLVSQGHKPFYFKKSDVKKMELAAKFNELKKGGGSSKVDRLIEKKRKRNATKVHKHVPYRREENVRS